jgi:hypothetical protein
MSWHTAMRLLRPGSSSRVTLAFARVAAGSGLTGIAEKTIDNNEL